tara:strand:+ start:3541 stop:4176 length:636 start_codon:yes stop_codon:yes gene_type:complete
MFHSDYNLVPYDYNRKNEMRDTNRTYMIYITHIGNTFANKAECHDILTETSRKLDTHTCAYGFLSKEVANIDLLNPSPKGLENSPIHTYLYMCIGKSKNKMLSFLFLDSDFILRSSILYSLRIQFNSPIVDEENINMYDKRDYFNNPLVTDLADLLIENFDEVVMDGVVVPTTYSDRILQMIYALDDEDTIEDTISESPLKEPRNTEEMKE